MPSATTEPRVRVDVLVDDSDRRAALYDATFWSLRQSPKSLPPIWLYDERGSQLFDAITRLPEYYVSRCERAILRSHADDIAARTGATTLVELGSGTSEKTRALLDALTAVGTLERFVPLDISEQVLRASTDAVAVEYPHISVHGLVGDFERHVGRLPDDGQRLVAFLGSTIGNLEPARRMRFLSSLASKLAPDDAFLLGIDLVKDVQRLHAAYNDAHGLTETFVRNGLCAVNRELGADFDQARFEYDARWDAACEWVDIGFTARTAHSVSIPELKVEVSLGAREWLRVEISAKFRRGRIEDELASAGLRVDDWWADRAGDFAVVLARRSPAVP